MNILVIIGVVMAVSFALGVVIMYTTRRVKERKVSLLKQFANANNYTYDQVLEESLGLHNDLLRIVRTNTRKEDRLQGLLPKTQVQFMAQDSPVPVLMTVDGMVSEIYLNFARSIVVAKFPGNDVEFVLLSKQNTRRFAAQQFRVVKKNQQIKLSSRFNRNFKLYVSDGNRDRVKQLFNESVQELLIKELSHCDILFAENELEISVYDRLYPERISNVIKALDEFISLISTSLPLLPPLPQSSKTLDLYGGFYKFLFREGWPRLVAWSFWYALYLLFGFILLVSDSSEEKTFILRAFLAGTIIIVFGIVRYCYYRFVLRSLSSRS